ncbi:extracellular catalytic domain type 1 short-chain-length polyhydroxyalkanoate depolymerase [Ottowia testudinis]|uniref:PHB depolymerase family esterase n=1 Tax=Ottowia testudinis TaxID=2816950 RepID=A0A975CFM4_9BURK|nr:PHB depolymerase family esterase [Ottowia testudinis]QTD44922.1 PHB depolymerase family esterase [Ottowia testudinis]
MTPQFHQLMGEATRLTQAGQLAAATALIQRALGAEGDGRAMGALRPAPAHGADVIDVQARVVESTRFTDAINDIADRAYRTGAKAPKDLRTPCPAAGAPDTFIAGHYAHPSAGARDYRLYIPPQAGSRPLPLVVMLHGCTQDTLDFARGTGMNEAARAQGLFVLYPEQAARLNPQRCWNWFKHSHQAAARGEPAILAGMVRQVMAQHAIDPGRVYVAGLSAGGAMAAILGQAHPELFAAVGVHSGLAAGSAHDLPSGLAAMQRGAPAARRAAVPTIVFHGDADRTVHPANGEQVLAAATPAGARAQAERVAPPGRRASTRRVQRDAAGQVVAEHWLVHGAGHAWSGGHAAGSFTDPSGPDATAEMLRFFLAHGRRNAR